MQYEHFFIKILVYNVGTWYILQHRYITGPIRFCPETCHVGGRILAAPTQTVPLNYCRGYFVAFVGAVLRTLPTGCDAVRLCRGRYYLPGCFPVWGNNVGAKRRQSTIKHLQCNSAVQCRNVVRPAENQLVKFWIHLPWRIMRPPMMHFTRSMAWIRPNRGMIPIPVNRLRTKAVGTHTAQTKQLSNRKVTMV